MSCLLTGAMLALAVLAQRAPGARGRHRHAPGQVDQARAEARSLAVDRPAAQRRAPGRRRDAGAAARAPAARRGRARQRRASASRRLEQRVTAAQERLRAAQARLPPRAGQARAAPGRDLQERHARHGDRAARVRRLQRPAHARATYLKEINDADQALVSRVQALRNKVRAALARVQALRAQAAAEVARLAAARAQVVADPGRGPGARPRLAAGAGGPAVPRSRTFARASPAGPRRCARSQAATRPGRQRRRRPSSSGSATSRSRKSIVMCESGGNYSARQPARAAPAAPTRCCPRPTRAWAASTPRPSAAPKSEQDRLAAKLWNGGAGAGNWECAK